MVLDFFEGWAAPPHDGLFPDAGAVPSRAPSEILPFSFFQKGPSVHMSGSTLLSLRNPFFPRAVPRRLDLFSWPAFRRAALSRRRLGKIKVFCIEAVSLSLSSRWFFLWDVTKFFTFELGTCCAVNAGSAFGTFLSKFRSFCFFSLCFY